MKLSILLSSTITFLFTVSMIISTAIFIKTHRDTLLNQYKEYGHTTIENLSLQSYNLVIRNNIFELRKVVNKAFSMNRFLFIAVLDNTGALLVSFPEGVKLNNLQQHEFINLEGKDGLYYDMPLKGSADNDPDIGKILLIIDLNPINESIKQATIRMIMQAGIIWLLMMIIIMLIVRLGTRSFIKFIRIIDSFGTASFNNLPFEINYESKISEIQILKKHFQQMLSRLQKYRKENEEQAKMAAIGLTTATLSHDIRKPFSQVKMILGSFELFKNNPSRLDAARQDVEKAIKNVEAMVNDIMDFSREVKLQTKATSLGGVFDFSLRQTLQSYPEPNIKITYNFKATKQPLIDEDRLVRVFGNIIGNGVEAITVIGKKQSGTITIETIDTAKDNTSFVEIIIGNDGPIFPDGAEDKLFESFYTYGKATGTGLGLASAQKIVHLHNGTIMARNKSNKEGVEFVIYLPASNEKEQIDQSILPENSKEVFKVATKDGSEVDALLEKVVLNKSTYKIILLEDEHLYRAWVKNLINQNEKLHNLVILYDAATVEEALDILKINTDITHAIVDIDLGQVKYGYDFLNSVKDNNKLSCLVHSNRTLPEFRQKALDLGAKAFVPKPLPLESLMGFLAGDEFKDEKPKSLLPKKKIIFYADDTGLMRDHFNFLCQQYQKEKGVELDIEIFETGEKLLTKAKEKKPDLVLTDLNMGEAGGILKGYDVIKKVKAIDKRIKAYLISNEPLILSEEPTKIAGGDGTLEQPMDQLKIFDLIDKII